eukprot:3938920-Rhodomonas_salina.1
MCALLSRSTLEVRNMRHGPARTSASRHARSHQAECTLQTPSQSTLLPTWSPSPHSLSTVCAGTLTGPLVRTRQHGLRAKSVPTPLVHINETMAVACGCRGMDNEPTWMSSTRWSTSKRADSTIADVLACPATNTGPAQTSPPFLPIPALHTQHSVPSQIPDPDRSESSCHPIWTASSSNATQLQRHGHKRHNAPARSCERSNHMPVMVDVSKLPAPSMSRRYVSAWAAQPTSVLDMRLLARGGPDLVSKQDKLEQPEADCGEEADEDERGLGLERQARHQLHRLAEHERERVADLPQDLHPRGLVRARPGRDRSGARGGAHRRLHQHRQAPASRHVELSRRWLVVRVVLVHALPIDRRRRAQVPQLLALVVEDQVREVGVAAVKVRGFLEVLEQPMVLGFACDLDVVHGVQVVDEPQQNVVLQLTPPGLPKHPLDVVPEFAPVLDALEVVSLRALHARVKLLPAHHRQRQHTLQRSQRHSPTQTTRIGLLSSTKLNHPQTRWIAVAGASEIETEAPSSTSNASL